MNIVDIIDKKRRNIELSEEEIKYVINGFLDGEVKDYQVSALLMAIVLNGMSDEEITYLTKYMIESGKTLDLSSLGSALVDKHSTGGVGDKTTLIIAPIVASCGVKVAKMSGRALGYTGGTIDKLEAIPGFKVDLSIQDFLKEVNDIGVAITSQTEDIAVADKKIYALRDVTATVESLPLIASSIMSKKIALGAKKLVLDVKVGSGALVKDLQSARKLSRIMIDLGKKFGMTVICILTNMDKPLGTNIGNALEIEECIEVLKDNKQGSLRDLCIILSSYMVSLGLNITYDEAKEKVLSNLTNGLAYKKFLELIKYQNGDITKLPHSRYVYNIKANMSGYLNSIDAYKIGLLSMSLGSGRKNKDDTIDYSAGIVLKKDLNDYIEKGDILMQVHSNREINHIDNTIFKIGPNKVYNPRIVYEVID